jgi:hypothetical protein
MAVKDDAKDRQVFLEQENILLANTLTEMRAEIGNTAKDMQVCADTWEKHGLPATDGWVVRRMREWITSFASSSVLPSARQEPPQ